MRRVGSCPHHQSCSPNSTAHRSAALVDHDELLLMVLSQLLKALNILISATAARRQDSLQTITVRQLRLADPLIGLIDAVTEALQPIIKDPDGAQSLLRP